jgi:hypothetical protein
LAENFTLEFNWGSKPTIVVDLEDQRFPNFRGSPTDHRLAFKGCGAVGSHPTAARSNNIRWPAI